jgi:hypothetical protein
MRARIDAVEDLRRPEHDRSGRLRGGGRGRRGHRDQQKGCNANVRECS